MYRETVIIEENNIKKIINRISYEIIEKNKDIENICMLGIVSRGSDIAKRIGEKIKEIENINIDVGFLNINYFRDDNKKNDISNNSIIEFDIEGKDVIIVDDVIFTCRTARAAIDAIISKGRPSSIQLAVLVDRGHKELPIKPDYIGKNIPTSKKEKIVVMLKEKDGIDSITILREI
ncbi:MAG: bifunctional pyr operon transcriptional regulator/uracil phosphoribosyltransferase PyrR [Oscillospiraceae bacterium]|nr:bifunctional pyr operon transcriptional regulator/uracil phosphoribosyltransferase PyrR [Oscillospiraceae bacterium]